MPLYEYECSKCGHRFEKIQKFSDAPVKKCPECGGSVHQVISAPAVQFKGSGWYVTDYARKGSASGHSNSENSEGSAKASSEEKGSKAESKGEAKAKSKPARK